MNIQRRVAEHEHATVIDSYSAFEKVMSEPLFYDQVHLSPHGNTRLANAVADVIAPMVKTMEGSGAAHSFARLNEVIENH